MGRGQQSGGTQRRKRARENERTKLKEDRKSNNSSPDVAGGHKKKQQKEGNEGVGGVMGFVVGWFLLILALGLFWGSRGGVRTGAAMTGNKLSNKQGTHLDKTIDRNKRIRKKTEANERRTDEPKGGEKSKSYNSVPPSAASATSSATSPTLPDKWYEKSLKCNRIFGTGCYPSYEIGDGGLVGVEEKVRRSEERSDELTTPSLATENTLTRLVLPYKTHLSRNHRNNSHP